ncbi:cuticle collagen 2C [Octodon degus]|uniref:Cuticle collagen 2C n=1 Tax=Octodon degus TaxID=10160 RepID=A0A6P3V9Z8_OCTDE|nr:cuticle collagen 2C [Octodon degus]
MGLGNHLRRPGNSGNPGPKQLRATPSPAPGSPPRGRTRAAQGRCLPHAAESTRAGSPGAEPPGCRAKSTPSGPRLRRAGAPRRPTPRSAGHTRPQLRPDPALPAPRDRAHDPGLPALGPSGDSAHLGRADRADRANVRGEQGRLPGGALYPRLRPARPPALLPPGSA